jgi:hypothetical protein
MGRRYYFFRTVFQSRPGRSVGTVGQQARRTWAMMQRKRHRDYRLQRRPRSILLTRRRPTRFARQTDGLLAILVFQYDHYEAGGGRILGEGPSRRGSAGDQRALFSLESRPPRARAGTPAKVRERSGRRWRRHVPALWPRYGLVIAHVWSWFKSAPGADENAEDMPQENAPHKGRAGVTRPSRGVWSAFPLTSAWSVPKN